MVTDEDVEWVRPVNKFDQYAPLIRDNTAFNTFVEEQGVVVALEIFTEFHRHIANLLIARAIDDPTVSPWAWRTIKLCSALKRRRNYLRGVAYRELGEMEAGIIIHQLGERFPRAVWGVDAWE